MDLPQENFDAATKSARATLYTLNQHAIGGYAMKSDIPGNRVNLRSQSTQSLQAMAWDLEAIQSALRMELNNRITDEPTDLA